MKYNSIACAVWIVGLSCLPGTVWAQSAKPDKAPAADRLPATIPIFPLPETVLFPSVSLPLHIFEPRYRAMVADALKGDRIIGMVLLQPGFEANYEGRPPVYPIGSAGVITQVEQLPDGRYNIVLQGLVKFRVTGEDQSRLYRLAHVNAIPEVPSEAEKATLQKQRLRLPALLAPYIERPGSELKFPPEIRDEELINTLAQYLDLDAIERQSLLEQQGVLARSQALIDLLELKVLKSLR